MPPARRRAPPPATSSGPLEGGPKGGSGRRKLRILVCRGPECGARWNSQAIYDAFARGLAERGLEETVELGWQSCFGRCRQAPNALVSEVAEEEANRRFVFASPLARRGRSALYNQLEPRDVVELIEEHVLRGRFVRRLIRAPGRAARRSDPDQGSSTATTSRPAKEPDDGDA